MGTNEFGIFHTDQTGKTFEDRETTFREFLKSLPKRLAKSWESITFDFDGSRIEVCRHWLFETDFDFENSISIEPA